jgi:hypothetical protein
MVAISRRVKPNAQDPFSGGAPTGVEIENIKSEKFNVKERLDELNQLGGTMLACGTCIESRNMQLKYVQSRNE